MLTRTGVRIQPAIRTIHLRAVTLDDVQWTNDLRFRDTLRQNADLRRRYAKLKLELKERFPDDRQANTDSKHDFIRAVIDSKE